MGRIKGQPRGPKRGTAHTMVLSFPGRERLLERTPEPPLLPRAMAGEWRGGRTPGPVWPDGLPVPVRLAGGSGPHPPSVYSGSNSMPGAEATCEGVTGRGERIHGTKGSAGRRGCPDTRVNQQTRRSRDMGGPGVRGKVGGPSGIQSSAEAAPKKSHRNGHDPDAGAKLPRPLIRSSGSFSNPPTTRKGGHPLCREQNSPCWPTTQDG